MSDTPDPAESAFVGALFGEDELGVVVRAHIHIEAKLLELLELLVANPQHLERMDLGFAQRVNLAIALGLKSEHASGLSALGTLRNAFAHRLDVQLSEDRVTNLYAALSSSDKEVVHLAYTRTNVQMGRQDALPFGRLSAKERFILISVALRAMLITAIGEIRARRPGV
jgi:hypothetical protein